MRTPAFVIVLSVCLAATAAQAVCTTSVGCIRERFGPNPVTRNNQIIDRTDRLGDRNRPVNPYVARQGLRVGPNDRTFYAPSGQQSALDSLQPNQLRPDVRYTPGATPGIAGQGAIGQGSVGQGLVGQDAVGQGVAPGSAVGRYDPAAPATGALGTTGSSAGRSATGVPGASGAQGVRRDPNAPSVAADGFYTGPRPAGATR